MDDEITDKIKKELASLDLGYKEGAWENFNQKQKKRHTVLLWRKMGIAAGILLFGLAGLFFMTENVTTPKKLVIKPVSKRLLPEVKTIQAETSPIQTGTSRSILPFDKKLISASSDLSPRDTMINMTAEMLNIRIAAETPRQSPITIKEAKNTAPVQKNGTQAKDTFTSLSSSETTVAKTKSKKWALGLVVGQAIDNSKGSDLALGTQIAFKLSGKLSVSSGIYYSELGGSKEFTPDVAALRSGKTLNSATTSTKGIDIPLDLQYQLSKKVYARMGISSYTITSQKQSLEYTEQFTALSSFVDTGGNTKTQAVTTNSITTESVPKDQLNAQRHVGLYNIAVGFDQKISPKNSVSIEPFMKIPFSKFTEHQVNLTQAGLRLKVNF